MNTNPVLLALYFYNMDISWSCVMKLVRPQTCWAAPWDCCWIHTSHFLLHIQCDSLYNFANPLYALLHHTHMALSSDTYLHSLLRLINPSWLWEVQNPVFHQPKGWKDDVFGQLIRWHHSSPQSAERCNPRQVYPVHLAGKQDLCSWGVKITNSS